MIRLIALCVAALGLSACQSVVSRHVDLNSGMVATGLHYSAPKAVMRVELFAIGRANDRAELYLAISRPFLVGDPEATYALTASTSMLADQRYVIVVNPQTRLLSYINSQSDGKAGEILKNIAQSIGAISSVDRTPSVTGDEAKALPEGQERLLYSTVIDPFMFDKCEFGVPCTLTKLNETLHSTASDFFECKPPPGSNPNAPPPPNPNRDACISLQDPKYFSVSLTPLFEFEVLGKFAQPEDCHSSICYRAPAPYTLGVEIAGVSNHSELVMLPNKSPILAMDLEAGVFADARTRVDLVHGMPATVAVTRKSELVAVTALPLQVITSLFDGVSKVFQLRINYGTQTGNLLESERRRLDALDRYNKYIRERDAATAALAQARIAEAAATPANRAQLTTAREDAEEDLVEAEENVGEAATELEDAGVSPPIDSDGNLAGLADGGDGDGGGTGDESGEIGPDNDTSGAGVWKLDKAPITTIERGPEDRLFKVNILTGDKETTVASTGNPADLAADPQAVAAAMAAAAASAEQEDDEEEE